MLKQGSFINKKYLKLFAGSLLGAIANGINTVLDSVLSGNQLGETALTAVSIVAPLAFIIYFFAGLYAPGYGILFGKHIGEFEKEEAYKTAGQSLITAATIGMLLASALLIFKKAFLHYYGCTGELYENASDYYNWKILSAFLLPFANSLYYLIAADADTFLISIAGIAAIITKVVSSSILCHYFGVSGLGIGTGICELVTIAIYGLHWMRKANGIHFKFSFRMKEFFDSVKLSSPLACGYLFVALTDIIMNKVILVTCGITMIAAYSMINLVYGIYDIYNAPYSAASGFTATFMGEKNNAGIKNVMKTTIKATVGLGLFLAIVLLASAEHMPKLYGMESPEVIDASVKAVRWMTLAAVPYGIAYVMESIYPSFGKIKLAITMALLNDFLCPLALSIPLAYIFGFTGVSAGIGINSYFVLGLFALVVTKMYGKKDFPLYLEDFKEEAVSFDIEVNNETATEIRDAVKSELDKRGYAVENIEILMEELYKRIYEKNLGKTVISECTLLFGDSYARIIVRDDGMIFNYVDENNKVESLNAHTLNSLLEHVWNKEYILTTSFNRNGFTFEKQ